MPDSLASPAAPHAASPRLWTLAAAVFAVFAVWMCAGAALALGVAMDTVADMTASGANPADAGNNLNEAQIMAMFEMPGLRAGLSIATSAVFAFVALVAARLSPEPLIRRLSLGPTAWNGARAAAGYAAAMSGALAVGIGGDVVARWAFGGHSAQMLNTAEQVLTEPMPWFVLLAVSIVAAAPIGEELLFRGYLQTRLVSRLGRWVGIVIASILFGLAHFDPMHVVLAAAIGLFLGWVADRTGSIRPAIAGHFFNNAVAVATMRLGVPDSEGVVAVLTLVVSVLICAASATVVVRLSPRS